MPQTRFLQTDEGIFIRSEENLKSVSDNLPVGTYRVVKNLVEFYLEPIDTFTRPRRYYGNLVQRATRIMETFKNRGGSTGVLLTGEQGSGKTQMARELSIMAAEQSLATIIVDTPYSGSSFNSFIQSISVPAVIIIDEFEKLYDTEDADQDGLLTLLDGVYPTKKLFVLTANNVYRINQHMLNRPGRIFYHLKYVGLDEAFIRDYCDENLTKKEELGAVIATGAMFTHFNFDMLKGLIEEINRYQCTAKEALEMMNISPDRNDDANYALEVHTIDDDLKLDEDVLYDKKVSDVNPLREQFHFSVRAYDMDDINKERVKKKLRPYTGLERNETVCVNPRDLVSINGGTMLFEHGRFRIKLTRIREKQVDYYSAF